MLRYYKAYGLNILSELELPELLHGNPEGKTDVCIRFGEIPEKLKNANNVDSWSQIRGNHFQLNIEETARYRAIAGEKIIIQPLDNTDLINVRLYLLGTVFGAILHQRNIVPLHASAILVNGTAIAFTGDSGSGKSTMAAYWHNRGYKIISDDMIALLPDSTGEIMVYGGSPRIKLWGDTIESLNIDKKNLMPDHVRMDKYHLMIHDNYQVEPVPLNSLFLLDKANSSTPEGIEKLEGSDAIITLLHNTYRPHFVAASNASKSHFLMCSKIAQGSSIYRLTRHWGEEYIESLLDRFEKYWDDKNSTQI